MTPNKFYSEKHCYTAKINKMVNDMILGKVRDIVTEAGIVHEYEINAKFVVLAVGKQTARKPIHDGAYYKCPECINILIFDDEIPRTDGREGIGPAIDNYCSVCGQKIDWEGVNE